MEYGLGSWPGETAGMSGARGTLYEFKYPMWSRNADMSNHRIDYSSLMSVKTATL